jgi:hypothetical protein
MALEFGDPAAPPALPSPRGNAANYMHFAGGRLRFGKLTMQDTDLRIVDADPSDPFRFYFAKYHGQLVAGTSRTTPDLGLVAVMPDADDLESQPSPGGSPGK